MTKREALELYEERWLPSIKKVFEQDGVVDVSARREDWNNFTDWLREEGEITAEQYQTWGNPY
jgi:hypothetical protein